ncbi:sensor histidine kinase [Paenibacillus sp. MBLB4367]|uniref:cache domain-containing sensor histidine kinase n=1 Tax=Paenibacillus sp. MBLB4367 TaxID=3384767 RepID=UPI0039083455
MIRSSIRNKLVLFLLAATIVPITTSIIITFYYTKQTVINETKSTNSSLIYQGKTNLVNYLNVIQQASLSIYNDRDLFETVESGLTDYLSDKEVYRGMQVLSHSVKEIYQVYLHVAKSNRSHLMVNERQRVETLEPRYVPALEPGQVKLEPTHMSHDYGLNPFTPEYAPPTEVITLHRSIYDVPTKQVLGSLSIDVSLDVIASISEQLYTKSGEELYILDEKGTVIYGPRTEQLGRVLEDQWVGYMMGLSEPKGSFEWNGDAFKGIQLYERMSTPYMNWTLVKRISNEVLYRNARQITLINSLVYSLFLIVVIAATVYISIRFTNPIRKLIGYINKIQSGNLNVAIDLTGGDEFGVLARRFRLMMQTLNNMILREYRLELANKTNELKALQAQINPHFLNNALQSIGTLALQQNQRNIYSLISSLGKMMRYSMNTNDTVVPLSVEADYVKAYLELQKQRFDVGLQYRFELTEEAAAALVPKMILQPIVENYFKHGFDSPDRDGSILIAALFAEDGRLRIEVSDNGRGMPPDKLAVLQQKLNKGWQTRFEGEESIGLLNVLARLKLYFNDYVEMQLENVIPHGMKVVLWIPQTKGGIGVEGIDR